MSAKKSAPSRKAESTLGSSRLIQIYYDQHKAMPNNVEQAKEAWDRFFVIEYGIAGTFIKDGRYSTLPLPKKPDYSEYAEESEEAIGLKDGYTKAYGKWYNEQQRYINMRPQIYMKMII